MDSRSKTKGLDRAELERISKLPDAEMAFNLYSYMCEKVMGRKAAPPSVTYAYGVYDTTGTKASDPRKRVTSDSNIAIPEGRTLRTEPEGQHIGKMAHTQQVRGSYTLYVDLRDDKPPVRFMMINGKPGERRFDPDANRYVDTLVEEHVNILRGFLTVDTNTNRRLFCFLELHPANWGSPVRKPEDCERLGFTVSTESVDFLRLPSIRTDVKLSADIAKVMDEARELELLSKLQACDSDTLRKTSKACGMSALLPDIDKTMQYRSFLSAIIKSKDTSEVTRNHKEIIKSALSGDEAFVQEVVNSAFELGVLTVMDGEYYFKGEHWDNFICPASRAGEERDHLISILSVPGHQDWVSKLDGAVGDVMSDTRTADKVFEQHDREIERAIAEGLIVYEKNKWYVKSEDGTNQELVSVAIGSKAKQLDGLKAWARKLDIEKLKEKLILLYAVD